MCRLHEDREAVARRLRWVAAAVVEAGKGFRKSRGHRDLVHLARALERHELEQGVRTEEEAA